MKAWLTNSSASRIVSDDLSHAKDADLQANVEIDPALLDPSQAPSASMPTAPKKRKHHLTATKDTLLGEIRDLNFAVVGTRLSRLARRLEGDYGGAKNLKSVSQMKEFVGKLGGLQSEQQNLRLRRSPSLHADRTSLIPQTLD